MSASEPVKLWRYALPNEKGEGWAVVHLDSSGFFATCSDYGNYAFHWRNWGEGRDFREFVIELARDPHYLGNKLDHDKWHEFDKEKTVARIREEIEEALNEGILKADDIREEQDRLTFLDSGSLSFDDWVREQGIFEDYCAAADLAATSPNASLHAFCTKTMPRLAGILLQELATERAQ